MKPFNLDSDKFFEYLKVNFGSILLDVRTDEEYESARIPGSILIDYYQSDFFDKIRNLDKSISYFVYCRSGRRSLEACYMMYEFGFNDVYNLKNGILGWKGEIVRG